MDFKKGFGKHSFRFVLITFTLVASFATRDFSSTDQSRPILRQTRRKSPANTAAMFVAEQLRQGKKPNRLINEKSPYLLQHAFNPMNWYPWGDEAFAEAREENKLIFLSIGYSTCYWCHVMEREVFENEEIAALMDKDFISIKVDREERPDVDRIYMNALQSMTTGRGGWPMSMFLAPDLKPFFGGSYMPPERFRALAEQIHQVWTATPEKITQSSRQLTEFLKKNSRITSSGGEIENSILQTGFKKVRQSYDKKYPGFGTGPKFPRPVTFNFLLRYYSRFKNEESLKMTVATLKQIRTGGIYDHLGGGFHRYSVDRQWRVPHFEKMLYDQAQLVISYLEAFQITKDADLAETARETLAYVLRVLTDAEGGFYSAEDAESALDPDKPYEKEEGAFYVWTSEEIDRILGKEAASVFKYVYGIKAGGNALEDPRKVFVNKNILYVAHNAAEAAKEFDKSPEDIFRVLADSRKKLMHERERRPRPHLDDKILTAWNGLMISAFARAYQVLDDRAHLRAATKAATFIDRELYNPKTKRLLRRYRDGEARHEGNLEDFAFFTMGLLDLYEASLDIRWLKRAIELTETQNLLFYDEENAGYFDTSQNVHALLFRTKEAYDGAEPAGNSIAILNLLRLAQMTDNQKWRKMAEQSLSYFSARVKPQPQAMPQLLAALDFHLDKPKQIIIAGNAEKQDTQRLLREVYQLYIPNKIILLADDGAGQQYLSRYIPFLKDVRMLDGKATAYICEQYACKLPTNKINVMKDLLTE